MCTLSLFQEVFGGTRVVYGSSRLRESLSGSLSVSSMWQLIGSGLLESLGGEFGESGRGLSFLSGGGIVCELLCACCVEV